MFETIVAIATPPIKSALGIIRVSGDDCFSVVSKIFSKDLTSINKNCILVGKILNKDKEIDQVVINVYKGPKSFTGEDSVEIMCHGSILIENEIIELLIKNGARLAVNGEYSSRAFLHGKIDLIQAEAINDLINATTKEAKNISLSSLNGEVSKLVYPIKKEIADLLSLIEVNIDFPEYEDIEIANKEKIISDCYAIIKDIDKLIVNGNKAKIIKDGISIAIVGKPNVGKSSLLNAMIGQNKAIVTDIAGTTRDIVEGEMIYKGIKFHLIDTAGIRKSKNKIEAIGVEKSKEVINKSDIIVYVKESSDFDLSNKNFLDIESKENVIVVYNKSDIKTNKDGINISALNNDIEPLLNEIYSRFGLKDNDFNNPALNNSRQIGLLEKVKEDLSKAILDCENNLTVDLISVSITSAYYSVLEILGENNQNDLSKEIFSRFCVGK